MWSPTYSTCMQQDTHNTYSNTACMCTLKRSSLYMHLLHCTVTGCDHLQSQSQASASFTMYTKCHCVCTATARPKALGAPNTCYPALHLSHHLMLKHLISSQIASEYHYRYQMHPDSIAPSRTCSPDVIPSMRCTSRYDPPWNTCRPGAIVPRPLEPAVAAEHHAPHA